MTNCYDCGNYYHHSSNMASQLLFIIIYINTKKKYSNIKIILHTGYIHDKYNIDYYKIQTNTIMCEESNY